MPASGGELRSERRIVRAGTGAVSIVRRFRVGEDGRDRCEALRLVAEASPPGFLQIDDAQLDGDRLEVVERHEPGFSIADAHRAIVDDLSVAVALSLVHDIAQTLVVLHELRPDAPMVHGNLTAEDVRLTPDAAVRIGGLSGRAGDPSVDVDAVMHLMGQLLEGRARTKEGALLLERLTALTFTNCRDLAHSIDIYLKRQEPQEVARRRLRFVTSTIELLAQYDGSEEPTSATDDGEDILSGDHWGALEPALDYTPFEDTGGSLPTIGGEQIEDLSDEGSSTAVDIIPELTLDAGGQTVEAAPSPIDLDRSRADSEIGILPTPTDESTEQHDDAVRAGLLGRASTRGVEAPGVDIGAYRVVASIGRGGMGEIYLARPRGAPPGEFVALKVLSAHGEDDEEALNMLLDEAAIMARIRHPNVLEVVDFGRADGRYFLATEYLEGRPLVRVMIEGYNREAGLDDGLIAAIGADVANGLFAAHTASNDRGEPLRVVHRDVSPQNIFVTYRGLTKVLDFGVARATERVSRTEVGFVKGKAAYMSPEQAEGLELDARSDVFSLGVCLWEMRAGRRLFKRDNEYETLLAVQAAPIDPPSSFRGAPNPVLDRIILGALKRDRDERTANAQQLARQLIDYASGVGIADREQAVADLLDRLFGDVAKQERALIAQLGQRAATDAEAEELEALSGVASRSSIKRITMVAEPEGLGALDDFGVETSAPALPRRETASEHVMDQVQRIHLERGQSLRPASVTPSERLTLDPDDGERTARERSTIDGEAPVADPFDAEPTRRFPHEPERDTSGGFEPLRIESVEAQEVVLPPAPPPPSRSGWPYVLVAATLLALIAGFVVVRYDVVSLGALGGSDSESTRAARSEPEVARVEARTADVTSAITATTATTAVDDRTDTAKTSRVEIPALVKLLATEDVGLTASEGTYLVDDGAGGSLAFDDEAKVTRVVASNAEGFVVQPKSRTLTSVGWIGRTDDAPWAVRGVSINDCPARVQIDARHLSIRYGGQDVRLVHGGGLLFDVELERPERATRLELDPLGLSFGDPDDTSGATHCKTGWWGSRVVLRRLPAGRYLLRWIGEGTTQTATLDVSPDGLDGGRLIRRSGQP